MADPITQPIHVDTRFDYRLMLADGRPALGVIGGGHAQPFTPQQIQQIAAHTVRCWNAFTFGKQPARPVALTEEQIESCSRAAHKACDANRMARWSIEFARAIERAHRIPASDTP